MARRIYIVELEVEGEDLPSREDMTQVVTDAFEQWQRSDSEEYRIEVVEVIGTREG